MYSLHRDHLVGIHSPTQCIHYTGITQRVFTYPVYSLYRDHSAGISASGTPSVLSDPTTVLDEVGGSPEEVGEEIRPQ